MRLRINLRKRRSLRRRSLRRRKIKIKRKRK